MEIFSPVDGTIVAINNETELDKRSVKYMEISVRVSNESKKFVRSKNSNNIVSPIDGKIDSIISIDDICYVYISGIVMSITNRDLSITKKKGDVLSVGEVIGTSTEDFKVRIYYLSDIINLEVGDFLKIGEKI